LCVDVTCDNVEAAEERVSEAETEVVSDITAEELQETGKD